MDKQKYDTSVSSLTAPKDKLDRPDRGKIEQAVYDYIYIGLNDAGLAYLSIQDEFYAEILALSSDVEEIRKQKKQRLDKLLKQLPSLTGEEWEEAQYEILQLLPNAATAVALLEAEGAKKQEREKIAEYSYYFEVRGKEAIKWEVLATEYKIPHWAFADQILNLFSDIEEAREQLRAQVPNLIEEAKEQERERIKQFLEDRGHGDEGKSINWMAFQDKYNIPAGDFTLVEELEFALKEGK